MNNPSIINIFVATILFVMNTGEFLAEQWVCTMMHEEKNFSILKDKRLLKDGLERISILDAAKDGIIFGV